MDIVFQAVMWGATAGVLLLYVKRRRNRKMLP